MKTVIKLVFIIIIIISSCKQNNNYKDKITLSTINQKADDGIFDLPINSIGITTKSDSLKQKDIDILLSSKALNFDGLKFVSKKFDYANLSLGSFRGTYFYNCNLIYTSAIRNVFQESNDFYGTRIENGKNTNMLFEFWKFREVAFLETSFFDSDFNNCDFYLAYFHNLKFTNVFFSNKMGGLYKAIRQNNVTYENCRFENVKMVEYINLSVNYSNCNFFDGEWRGVQFNNIQELQSKIISGLFEHLHIVSGDYSKIIITPNDVHKTKFSGVRFENTCFRGSVINAWFCDSCLIVGGNSDFSNVNFQSSIFDETIFGSATQLTLLNLKNAKFAECEFRDNVTFIKCDLTGATWPSNISNVRFISCQGH
jgi:uncharacterized protein YjbI with pentapeptide repeats